MSEIKAHSPREAAEHTGEGPADFHEPVKKQYTAEISLWFEFDCTENDKAIIEENLKNLASALMAGCVDCAANAIFSLPCYNFSEAREALNNDCGKIINWNLNIHEEKN